MDTVESRNEKLAAILAEYATLDRVRDATRLCVILEEAAELVDREAQPKKWASFRGIFAQLSESSNPRAAIQAYRDALTVWDSQADRDSWVACHMGIGTLMAKLSPLSPEDINEAIDHLEYIVSDLPYLASYLAVLYEYRVTGDPYENWRKRFEYLTMDLAQTSREQDLAGWARKVNQLAIGEMDEPNADFNDLFERRIARHRKVLDALSDHSSAIWIDTCLYLSECFTFRVSGNLGENHREAERYAQDALTACAANTDSGLRARALLNRVRVAQASPFPPTPAAIQEHFMWCGEADRLIDPKAAPALKATVESYRANADLNLIQLGEPVSKETLVAHVESALTYLDPKVQLRERRSIFQVAGEGLLALESVETASVYLTQAVEAAEEALAAATSRPGRMERIWEFRDSCALLSYTRLRLGQIDVALVELDRGKARIWSDRAPDWTQKDLKGLIPAGGALLFPNFAAKEGAVVVVTVAGTDIVWLPKFGKPQLLRLLRGGVKPMELGGWLKAYYDWRDADHAKNSQLNELLKAWMATIENTGQTLFEDVWAPVLAKLKQFGVVAGAEAELVLFPQGGSAVFPWHAAWVEQNNIRRWLLEDYAIRYAPSVRALLTPERGPVSATKTALWITNPTDNLAYSELECAWAKRRLPWSSHEFMHGEAATPTAVLDALPRASIAHFSCHAQFNLEDPLRSCLLLAKWEPLTIESLQPVLADHAPQLVILSACETGMARVTITPDELLGFPSAWIHAGTRTVLATLWPVDDPASAVLVGQFYKYLFEEGKSPAQALRDAQNFMRTATGHELRNLLVEFKDEPPPVGRRVAEIRNECFVDQKRCRFESPFYWAAFALFGRE